MAWRNATRERDGVKQRRCGNPSHKGARWLVLSLANFFTLRSYYCRECQRTYARLNWQSKHPKVARKAASRKPTKSAKSAALDDLAHAMSGWGRSW